MSDEVEPGTPGYESRRMLKERAEKAEAGLAALMARIEALEASKTDPTQAIVEALKQDRESTQSAALKRELAEAQAMIEHLQRPQTPTSGIPYRGYVQAKEDSWDMTGYHLGPKDGKPGDVFMVDMQDYWPGCPFTPVIVKGTKEDGVTPIVAPHPDFQSH